MRTLTVVSVLFMCALAGAAQAEWTGREVTEDGVLHIKNSETAVTVIRVEPEALWERGGENDELFFGRLSQIVQDAEGNVYVLDSQLSEILVFSPSGEHLRTIGREGEGPGEFANVSDMYLSPNGLLGIVRIFPGRIYQIGTDGSPADYFPLPESGGFQLVHRAQANSDHVVVVTQVTSGEPPNQTQTTALKAFDLSGNELVHYCDVKGKTRFGGMRFDEKTFSNFARRWTLADDGRVAVNLSFDDYTINVYNADGMLDRVIERPDHQPLKRSKRDYNRFQKLYDGITQWSPGRTFKVSETHGAIAGLWFRPDGSLWVLSNRAAFDRPEGLLAGIDEFDRQGHFTRRIDFVLEGDPVEDGIFIMGERLYRVTDLFSSFMAALGGDEEQEDAAEAEPLRLIAYNLNFD
ncbi:MAG: 6-bladed beta-propeller [Candidatus Krumholzibacteria bacterium]|nr:6-bladed beta-propeller [Candidatus Krumholzibacteria bacterium]